MVNAAVSGDSTIYRRDINIGIAVALDWGLIVPVIKHADELSLLGLARAINDLGERARTKKLSPDDIQRGTFTITNPGGFGPFAGMPIINQPQVAILGVGAIEKRPKVVTLPDGTDAIAIRTMGMLTHVLRPPRRGRRRRRPVPGRREEVAAGLPGRSGLTMPKVLTAHGCACRARTRPTTWRRCASCASSPTRGASASGCSATPRIPRLFIEFSESPTEMSHRAQASRLPEEIKLEKRLQSARRPTRRMRGSSGPRSPLATAGGGLGPWPARIVVVDGERWEVLPVRAGHRVRQGSVRPGVPARHRARAQAPLHALLAASGPAVPTPRCASSSERQLLELFRQSQPAWTAPESAYGAR